MRLREEPMTVFIVSHLVFTGTRMLAIPAIGHDGFHEPCFARIPPQAPRLG
jgi:hypothetical protein